jgi:hypothetical protein
VHCSHEQACMLGRIQPVPEGLWGAKLALQVNDSSSSSYNSCTDSSTKSIINVSSASQ